MLLLGTYQYLKGQIVHSDMVTYLELRSMLLCGIQLICMETDNYWAGNKDSYDIYASKTTLSGSV